MQGAGFTIKATLMILVIFIFLLLYLEYKILRDRKKLSENDDENPSSSLYYGGFGGREVGIFDEGGEDPNQVGGYAGPGVVDEEAAAEWI